MVDGSSKKSETSSSRKIDTLRGKENKVKKINTREEHLIPTEEKIFKARFYVRSTKKYKYITLKIAPSTIAGAGMGVFTVDPIPAGAEVKYKGVKKIETAANLYYSWEIIEFSSVSGKPKDSGKILYYIDGSKKSGNFTSRINCGMKQSHNNFDVIQRFDNVYYFSLIDIPAGRELFIDYGEQYRKCNLNMKGKY
jgi:hypothetical protein